MPHISTINDHARGSPLTVGIRTGPRARPGRSFDHPWKMTRNDRGSTEAPNPENATGGGLAGQYPANRQRGGSIYPPTVETVEVRPEVDGYHDILLLDGDGQIVYTHNRATHRIQGALEGGEGYDIIVREEA